MEKLYYLVTTEEVDALRNERTGIEKVDAFIVNVISLFDKHVKTMRERGMNPDVCRMVYSRPVLGEREEILAYAKEYAEDGVLSVFWKLVYERNRLKK